MKILSNADCSQWLGAHGIPEKPYDQQKVSPPLYEQVDLPSTTWGSTAAIRNVVAACEPFEAALFQFTYWETLPGDQVAIVSAVRRAYGEPGPLIDSPGHLFEPSERETLIGMSVLAVLYHWSAYVYFSHGTILFWWEGEILDVWPSDARASQSILQVFEDLRLSPTPAHDDHPTH